MDSRPARPRMRPLAVILRALTLRAAALRAALLCGLLLAAAPVVMAQDQPPPQSPQEAQKILRQIMKGSSAVVGRTARGQTLDQAPPFTVVPRKPAMTMFPCTNCHDNKFVDRRVRVLTEEHKTLVFDHGGGRLWCYDACHNGRDMDHLTMLRRRPVEYDESYRVCGQCHFERQKDWAFGGHGRRAGAWADPMNVPADHKDLRVADRSKIGTWKGPRTVLGCTACHNPHSPSIKPFQPSPPPPVRPGLAKPADIPPQAEEIWVRVKEKSGGKK